MKKFIQPALVAALLLGAGAAQAQLSAGHIMLTGSAGYSMSKPAPVSEGATKNTTGRISPQIGYFIADNLAIGLNLSYVAQKSIYESEVTFNSTTTKLTDTETNSTMTFGPFVRYYKPVGERAAFFGQAGVGFGSTKYKSEDQRLISPGTVETNSFDIKYSQLSAGISPGFTFFPTDNFGLEVMLGGLGWNRTQKKDLKDNEKKEDFTSSDFDFSLGLQGLSIGATWYLGGK